MNRRELARQRLDLVLAEGAAMLIERRIDLSDREVVKAALKDRPSHQTDAHPNWTDADLPAE